MVNFKEKIYFDELFWEKYVQSHPKEFLNEDMKPVSKQERVLTGRMDLTFRDVNNVLVIVEIQRNALDRTHFYKTLDYKEDLILNGEKKVRTICLCNRVEEKWEIYKKRHDLEIICIPEKIVKNKIKKISPNIEFVNSKEEVYEENNDTEEDNIKKKIFIETTEDLKEFRKLTKNDSGLDKFNQQAYVSKYQYKNNIFSPAIYETYPGWVDFRHDGLYFKELKKKIEQFFFLSTPQKKALDRNWRMYSPLDNLKNRLDNILDQFELIEKTRFRYKPFLHDLNNFNYKKLLIESEKEFKFRKPKIQLVLITDTYFGRNNLLLYWLPYPWAIKDGKIVENDFNFTERYMEFIKYNKENHEIFCLDNILEDEVMNNIEINTKWEDYKINNPKYYIKNLDGHIAKMIDYTIKQIKVELSANFEVIVANPIHLITRNFDEVDYLIEDLDPSKSKKKILGYLIEKNTHLDPEYVIYR